jgi:hypothetical protein
VFNAIYFPSPAEQAAAVAFKWCANARLAWGAWTMLNISSLNAALTFCFPSDVTGPSLATCLSTAKVLDEAWKVRFT